MKDTEEEVLTSIARRISEKNSIIAGLERRLQTITKLLEKKNGDYNTLKGDFQALSRDFEHVVGKRNELQGKLDDIHRGRS